jgi:methyltransferase (TIGR00027 family)
MSEIQNPVCKTSLVMAAKRAIENKRADRLFVDPFAEKLAAAEINTCLEKWKKVEGDFSQIQSQRTRFVDVRTRFFDDFLMSVASKISQVIILGSGMDTRAFRLPWSSNTHLYELDRAEVIEKKEAILQDIPAKCHRQAIATDLRQAWFALLVEGGYRAEIPSVWLMEGLLTYLNRQEVHDLLKIISDSSTSGSYIGADLVSVKSLELGLKSNDIRKHWRFGTDEPQQLFQAYGWQASLKQPGEEGASFGRYKKSPPPLEIPNLRRCFFVTARKEKEDNY